MRGARKRPTLNFEFSHEPLTACLMAMHALRDSIHKPRGMPPINQMHAGFARCDLWLKTCTGNFPEDLKRLLKKADKNVALRLNETAHTGVVLT